MSVIGRVLHAVQTLYVVLFLRKEPAQDRLSRSRVVVGDGKTVRTVGFHDFKQFPAGDFCIRLIGMIMQFITFEHGRLLLIRR